MALRIGNSISPHWEHRLRHWLKTGRPSRSKRMSFAAFFFGTVCLTGAATHENQDGLLSRLDALERWKAQVERHIVIAAPPDDTNSTPPINQIEFNQNSILFRMGDFDRERNFSRKTGLPSTPVRTHYRFEDDGRISISWYAVTNGKLEEKKLRHRQLTNDISYVEYSQNRGTQKSVPWDERLHDIEAFLGDNLRNASGDVD